jgi:hypothetical protein
MTMQADLAWALVETVAASIHPHELIGVYVA